MTNGTRCVVVVDEALAPGLAANAAAVMAMTLGTKVPALVGDDFADGAGETPPGPDHDRPARSCAPRPASSPALRAKALEAEVGVIGFPHSGQTDHRLRALPRAMVAETPTLDYLGLALYGAGKTRCAGSPAASGCSAGVRDDRDLPQDRRDDRRRDRRGRSPRRRRSSGSARSPWPTAWPSRPCSSAFSSSAAGPGELEREDRERDRDHRQRRAGQDEHRQAREQQREAGDDDQHAQIQRAVERGPRAARACARPGSASDASSVLILLR